MKNALIVALLAVALTACGEKAAETTAAVEAAAPVVAEVAPVVANAASAVAEAATAVGEAANTAADAMKK